MPRSTRPSAVATPKVAARPAKAATRARRTEVGPESARPTNRRGEARREALLEAARELFLQHGYAGASMEELIQRTGGSKASLYSYFGSKDGLFEVMVVEGCAQFLRDVAIPTKVEGDLESTLCAFGLRFFRLFTEPTRVQLMRTIIAEANRFPRLAEQFYENGPRRARKQLAAFLADCHQQGLIVVEDPDFAAIQLITLMKGHCQFRSLLGFSPLGLPISAERFVEQGVRLFLYGCQPAAASNKKPVRSRP